MITPDSHSSPLRRVLAGALTASAAAVLLASCASYREIAPATQPIATASISAPAGVRGAQDAWPADDWWLALGDEQLNRLMQKALDGSPNLAAAQARIARAQAATDLNRAATGVQVNGAVDATYGRQSANSLIPPPPLGPGGEYVSQGQVGVSFGYDLDFWGKNASLIRSAEAQLKAANYDRDAARLALTTSVGRAYAQLAAQYDQEEVLRATKQQRHAVRDLIAQRVKSGLDTQVEAKTAETNEASLDLELEQLATAMQVTRLQIAALTGQMPDAAASIAKPNLATASFTIPQNLPLDLLGRRPELAAQRARITSAYSEVDAAKAQFYPNINLTGLVGLQAIGLGQLFNAGSFTNSIGPALRLPIFDAGRLRANYAARTADIDAAVSQYNQSVLGAAQDVAEQLTRVNALAREEAAARNALAAAEEAHRLAMLRYRGGLTPYLNVLTIESQLLAQRRAYATVKSRYHDLQIELIRALGGGFNEQTTRTAAAPANTTTRAQ
ncbi:efflux transporter outer membrane subunit [Oxalobacteraceae bacterium OM1]|nr:efflux transporter outer membrane subunit [Oxalobacteraceae bacterium OM1]